jgi:hypothetical protein
MASSVVSENKRCCHLLDNALVLKVSSRDYLDSDSKRIFLKGRDLTVLKLRYNAPMSAKQPSIAVAIYIAYPPVLGP